MCLEFLSHTRVDDDAHACIMHHEHRIFLTCWCILCPGQAMYQTQDLSGIPDPGAFAIMTVLQQLAAVEEQGSTGGK